LVEEKPEINLFAVRELLFTRKTTAQVAERFSVSQLTVLTWTRNFEKKFPKDRYDWSAIDELSQLKKENKRLLAAIEALKATLQQQDDCEF
jgi:transposase